VRILDADGSSEFVPINATSLDGRIVNDLTAGKYDVVVSVGPSFTSRREEARESMIAFMQAMPQSAAMIADLFAKANDWEGAEEMARRLRLPLLAQGIVEPEEGDPPPQPQQPGPEVLLAQAEQMKAQAAILRAEVDAMKVRAEIAKLEMEAGKMRADVGLDLLSLGQKQQAQNQKHAKAQADTLINLARAAAGR
jgi:hypothetical protein